MIKGSTERVTVLRQGYFVTATNGEKYSSSGTNWENFNKNAISLLIGNEVDIAYTKGGSK
jgi:hypothetical protein